MEQQNSPDHYGMDICMDGQGNYVVTTVGLSPDQRRIVEHTRTYSESEWATATPEVIPEMRTIISREVTRAGQA